uniref:WAT1-related protein n=1 Tax=Zea mays TaxID=4577 RepID=A0A804QN49_MAIZE
MSRMGGKDCVPPVAMVLVQLGFAVMNIVSKLALDAGMSPYVLIAYRNLIAAAVISPIAYLLERCFSSSGACTSVHSSASPHTRTHLIRRSGATITKKVLLQIFCSSIFGYYCICSRLGNAEPGAVRRGAQVHQRDRGVRAHQHAAGADLRDGGGAQDGAGAAGHGGGAGQAGGHGGVRGRIHAHTLLQGPRPQGVGVPDPLALRGARVAPRRRRRGRRPHGPRRGARGRPRHRQLRRLGRLVHSPHQDLPGVLRALHQHRHHVPHGGRAVRGRQRRPGPEPRRLEARVRHQALLRALHRDRWLRGRVHAHVVVHPGARPAVRVHVQPAAARHRRRRRLGHPRRQDTPGKCYRLRAHRCRAIHGALGQRKGDGQTGPRQRQRRRGDRRRIGPCGRKQQGWCGRRKQPCRRRQQPAGVLHNN